MSYVGMAANVVGGELQGWASVLERQAIQDELDRELQQQQVFRGQGQDIFQGALSGYGAGAANQQLAQGKANRIKAYRGVEDVPLGFSAPGQKGFATDTGYGRLLGSNRAGLGSYSDFALNQALASNNRQRLLNQLASSAGGNAGLYPYYQYQAQHSMDDLAMIGAAISSIGGGAANYAQYAQGPQGGGQGQPMLNPYAPYGYSLGLGGGPGNYWNPGSGANTGWDY